jgi:guanylate kinase
MSSEPRGRHPDPAGPGILLVIAGPSGAGKTTLAHHLVSVFPEACFSVSVTTRPPRGSEQDGIDYLFISDEEFDGKLAEGYFLEWAEVHGHRYGTSAVWTRGMLASGRSVILDIDVQGAVQVRESFPGAVLVFVLPPSPAVLMKRLLSRSTDAGDSVRLRLAAALTEIGWMGVFDYYIRNDSMENSLDQVEAIFRSELSRLSNRTMPPEVRSYGPGRFEGRGFWCGKTVVVASGPTRERIDDVRFVSNRSSGRMGSGLAEAFRDAGAKVVFITGPSCQPPPSAVEVRRVESARDLLAELRRETGSADLLVMAAAVADMRPAGIIPGKIPRGERLTLEMEPVPDLLAALTSSPGGGPPCPVLAFALEYGEEGLERAVEKMRRKGASAIFMNRGDQPGAGMESLGNQGVLLFDDGSRIEIPPASKRFVAEQIAAAMGRYRSGQGAGK